VGRVCPPVPEEMPGPGQPLPDSPCSASSPLRGRLVDAARFQIRRCHHGTRTASEVPYVYIIGRQNKPVLEGKSAARRSAAARHLLPVWPFIPALPVPGGHRRLQGAGRLLRVLTTCPAQASGTAHASRQPGEHLHRVGNELGHEFGHVGRGRSSRRSPARARRIPPVILPVPLGADQSIVLQRRHLCDRQRPTTANSANSSTPLTRQSARRAVDGHEGDVLSGSRASRIRCAYAGGPSALSWLATKRVPSAAASAPRG